MALGFASEPEHQRPDKQRSEHNRNNDRNVAESALECMGHLVEGLRHLFDELVESDSRKPSGKTNGDREQREHLVLGRLDPDATNETTERDASCVRPRQSLLAAPSLCWETSFWHGAS